VVVEWSRVECRSQSVEPWFVASDVSSRGSHWCLGALLAKRCVVTFVVSIREER